MATQAPPFRLSIQDSLGLPEVSIHGPADTPVLLLRSCALLDSPDLWELVDATTLTDDPSAYYELDYDLSAGSVVSYLVRNQVRAYVVCGPWHVWSEPSAESSMLATPTLRT